MDDLWHDMQDTHLKETVPDIDRFLSETPNLSEVAGILVRISGRAGIEKGTVGELIAQVVYDDCLLLVPTLPMDLASHHSEGWIVCTSG